jgi:RNA polymerase sigma-70 factor (ECF subfamily)
MIADGDDVSDILQDVFIDLFGKLNNGNEIRYPKSWLIKATCNKCIDKLRKRRLLQGIESAGYCTVEPESLEKQELKEAVKTALIKLKPRDRMLAVLYSEGFSYKEIAEASGIRFSSVGKLLSRTLEKIAKDFKNKGYEMY